jgi:flavorubredoxin
MPQARKDEKTLDRSKILNTMKTSLAKGVDWVGYVDWTVRDFHGYVTDQGSTYNSFLIRDDKVALIDAVKAPYAHELLDNISRFVDCRQIDYVVVNHAEPDHSGALPEVMKACPQAVLVCDKRCETALGQHFDTRGWKFQIVKDGDTLSLGKRNLRFVETPMVHWPESMATYLVEDKILFSMDAFGQHLATTHRFDDEVPVPLDLVMFEAKKYYANIVMPFGSPVRKTLEKASKLDIQILAPSHGVVWRRHIADILRLYQDWTVCKSAPKVLVAYDTMWESTARMAHAINDGASVPGVEAKLIYVRASDLTTLATEAIDTAAFAFGSPTLNKTLMPEMAAALTYLKGLSPTGKAGFAFGSYGWSKGGAKAAEEYMTQMGMEIMREPLECQYRPTAETLKECFDSGRLLAEKALIAAEK